MREVKGMEANKSEYLNSRQMAARLSVSIRSLERHRANGLIPYVPLTKRTYLYSPTRVFEALEHLEIPVRTIRKRYSKTTEGGIAL